MKKLSVAIVGAALLVSSGVVAHPTDIPYETRGECESAYAEFSKFDRNRLVDLGVFETRGAAQSTFQDIFACEYFEEEQAWYIVFIGG